MLPQSAVTGSGDHLRCWRQTNCQKNLSGKRTRIVSAMSSHLLMTAAVRRFRRSLLSTAGECHLCVCVCGFSSCFQSSRWGSLLVLLLSEIKVSQALFCRADFLCLPRLCPHPPPPFEHILLFAKRREAGTMTIFPLSVTFFCIIYLVRWLWRWGARQDVQWTESPFTIHYSEWIRGCR